MNIELQVKNLFTNVSQLDESGFVADFYYIAKEYARQQNAANHIVSSSSDFENSLYELINRYVNAGLKKADLIHKMKYVTKSCEMS